MSDLKLIVPIAAQVLVVFEENKVEKLNLRSRLSEIANQILGKDLQYNLDELLEPRGKVYLEKGIHLHWKLPKLLKHGTTNEQGENLKFPAVPNRWMLVRYQTNIEDAENIPVKVWVVKSDVINEGNDKLNWVVLDSGYKSDPKAEDGTMVKEESFVFNAIGKSEPLTQPYTETENNAIELSAVGAANPFFSSIYDESKNIFGFYDDMVGANENDVFSYVITGWYSNPKNDPLNPETTIDEALVAKIKKNWLEGITENPTKTLFCHQRYGVVWKESRNVPTGDVNVSIGNTSTEALSAYLKKVNTHPLDIKENDKETYLNAMFNLLLEDEKERRSIEKIKLENHRKQFSPKSRGILWEVKKIESNNYVGDKDKETPFFPADVALVAKLKELNKLQLYFNETTAQLKSLRQEYYFDWYKLVLINQGVENQGITDESLRSKMESLKGEIKSLNDKKELLEGKEGIMGKIQQCISEINIQHNIKINEKGTQHEYEYELVKVNEDLFWQPSDPALLFYGNGLGNVKKIYQDINDKVICRLSSQIINQLTVINIDYQSGAIFGIAPNVAPAIRHDEDIQKLVYEAFLLDPTCSVFTAIKSKSTLKTNKNEVIEYVRNNIVPAQDIAKKGITETFAYKTHTQDWEPLFILWELIFKPNGSKEEISCRGLSPMTSGINKTLSDVAPNSNYEQILSQNLSGFNKFLLAQYPSLQLPPLLYSNDSDSFKPSPIIDQETLEILGYQSEVYALAPIPESLFSPVLDGELTIKKLSLLDSFGQQRFISVVEKNIIIAEGLTGNEKDISQPIKMPKRIIQPTRLHFDWLNDKGEVLFQDTGKIDHPIMGWLVPNFLDNMVMIYDHQGHEVKSIGLIDNNKTEAYYPTKDGELTEAELKKEREAVLTPTFKAIIEKLDIKKIIAGCKELRQRLPKTNTPLSTSAVAMLYGTPIAVAKGRLRLEMLGNIIKNPSWEAKDTDTGNIENLNISLTMGDNTQKDDGLVGYFIGEEYHDTSTAVLQMKVNTAQDVTVLLDAASGFYVSADGGILPTPCIKLFPHAVEELSKEISISLMVSPFISDKNQSYIPTPNTPDAQWNWIHKTSVNIWENPSTVKKNSQHESFDFSGQQLYEGWIKMDALKPKNQ